ncbi:MAG: peptidase T [Lachnospiraceae bacterium]|nr:peptidase T [Lachnospiraceae bacterium]
MIKNKELIERFLRYVKIDTKSDEDSGCVPSTAKQHDLARLLDKELREMGMPEVIYDTEHCVIYAYLPGNDPASENDAIGFISHMDTSPAVSGENVRPRILENYDGRDSLLDPKDFPVLAKHIGEDLIATDGTTLLGADDKAGVAEIMTMLSYFLSHPCVPRRPIAVAFTPDEEIGHGVDHFDVTKFRAPFAYTADGGAFGAIEYETFNAAAAEVAIRGRSVHPGSAKGLMINAAIVATEFNALLPDMERPEHTEGREGFYMLMDIGGECETAHLSYIVRDHDRDLFEARKAKMEEITRKLNEKYGEGTVSLTLTDQYYNMASVVLQYPALLRRAEEAIRSLGTEPYSEPVRGGTDGSRLSFMGLPCPNLATGGYNYHSRYEFASIQEMEKCCETLIRIAKAG